VSAQSPGYAHGKAGGRDQGRTGTGRTDEDHPELLSRGHAGRSSGSSDGGEDRVFGGRGGGASGLLELLDLVVQLDSGRKGAEGIGQTRRKKATGASEKRAVQLLVSQSRSEGEKCTWETRVLRWLISSDMMRS
jgi:hypothetical protein